MKLSPFLPALLGAGLLGVVLANTVIPRHDRNGDQGFHRFEARLSSPVAGTTQLFYNAGRGFTEADSARARLEPGAPAVVVFPLAAESIRDLRFDTTNNDAPVTIEDALIRRPDGTVVKRFSPADFVAFNQIARIERRGAAVVVHPTPGANDPHVRVLLGVEIMPLVVSWSALLLPFLLRGLPVFLVLLAGLAAWHFLGGRWRAGLAPRFAVARAWTVAHPKSAVALAAGLAMVLSSYPVIFCGASYVSPNYGTSLLYEDFPTLPGSKDSTVVDVRGADIGAIMWSHVPLSATQSRALLHDFELPLWNRYNSAGTTLLGQGQTMFGDPLHFGVILAGGASWAWDLKYLAAKWLLGVALGLTVLHTARHLPAALIVAFASIFVGFFTFRVNHPAFFSFCYGPWILYAWCRIVDAKSRRGLYFGLLGLMAANWTLMVSGTAKEAYVSLLTLNFAGLMMLLCAAHAWRERLLRLGAALAAGVAFALLAAPAWLTFYDTIKGSYSSYNETYAFQLQPGLALGFFDEALLRPFWEDEKVFNPSSNFLILLGVLAYLVNLRALAANRFALALGLAALLPVSFVFGLVPPLWIASWPFLGNIHHIDNSFGVGLIHLLALLAGFGFARMAGRLGREEGRGDLALGGLLLFALVLHYIGLTQVVQRSTYSFLKWGQSVPRSYFVWGSFAVSLAAAIGLVFAARHLLKKQAFTAGATLVLSGCVILLLWRHGLQLHSPFPNYTLNAAPRARFDAPSPALQAIRAQTREPVRIAGFIGNFFPGWTALYGLEGVSGPDALVNRHMRELQTAFAVERIWDWRLVLYPRRMPQDLPFYDLLNVRYYLGPKDDPAPGENGLQPVTKADLAVWRSETAWPRAFFTNRLATYDTAENFAALVRAGDHRPLAAVQAGDQGLPALPAGDLAGRTVTPASNYRLTNNTTSFTVDAGSAGVIVLGEAWLENEFTATLNGRPAPLFRVNHAFKGLYVPQGGTYQVTVRYRPHRFNLSLGLCFLGLVATGGSGWWIFRRFPAVATPA